MKQLDNTSDNANQNFKTLGIFLRSHRERMSPSAASSARTRRRTPGLLREEVAQSCGVSTTWYTWLEQGRSVSASAGALSRISCVLQLTVAERAYLFEVAGVTDPENENETEASTEIPLGLESLVTSLSVPAYLLDRQWNAIVWNRAAAKLLKPWLEDSHNRNLLRFLFLSSAAKDVLVDWNERASRVVAEFRADRGRHLNDRLTLRLLETLKSNSSVFARLWEGQDVKAREGGIRRFRSSNGQIVSYEQVAFVPSTRNDLRHITLTPIKSKRTR
jgi:transcriptional regulator with XRE-family HTH domain